MKKNTLRKLTLSAVTMGVAALSLTSTTYAWFTTNGSATASGISGSVTSPNTLMLIKSPTGWNGSNPIYDGSYKWDTTTMTSVESASAQAATFQTSTVLVNESGNGDTRTTLSPVSIYGSNVDASNGTFSFKKLNANHAEELTTSVTSSDYLHYQVVISISGLAAGQNYDVTMTLPALNENTATQYLLVDAGSGQNGATAGKTIKVGIADALSLGIKNTIISGPQTNSPYGVTTGGTVSSFTSVDDATTDASGFYRAKAEDEYIFASTDTYSNTGTGSLTGTAVKYYQKVYGLSSFTKPNGYDNLYTTTGDNNTFAGWSTTAKKLYTVTGTANNDSFVCVTDLYFFIDGWDNQCFNAIGGLDLFKQGDSSNANDTITFACNPSQSN